MWKLPTDCRDSAQKSYATCNSQLGVYASLVIRRHGLEMLIVCGAQVERAISFVTQYILNAKKYRCYEVSPVVSEDDAGTKWTSSFLLRADAILTTIASASPA